MGLIFTAFGILKRIPWWAYLFAGLLAWGATGHWEATHYKKELAALQASERSARDAAELTAKAAAEDARVAKEKRNAQDKNNASQLAAALQRLRDRPDRLPAAATPACSGGTGAALSRPDAEFLTGFAARAGSLQSALDECQDWVKAVKRTP